MGRRKGEKIMKIPAEFEDIFRGVELTEREALFLSWITSWDDYTVQNMRTVVEKVRSALSTLQAENEKLRAELEQVKREKDAAVECCRGYCESYAFERDCTKHDMNDAAPTRWYYGDCEDWEWRGPEEG